MAAGDIKIFTIVENGVTLEATAVDMGNGTTSISIKCLSGSADVNAFWFSDGDSTGAEAGSTTLSKQNSSLNMNGTGEVWDGYEKLSSPGLGTAGTSKSTYLTANQSLAPFTINWSWDALDTIGIRATSVGDSLTSIKGVSGDATVISFPTFSADDVQVTEGTDGTAAITITLNDGGTPYPYSIAVSYSTTGVSATDGSDYTGVANSITFAPGETTKTIYVTILNNAVVEGNETFTFSLLSAVPDVPGSDPTITLSDTATVTIVDDDQLTFSIKETGDAVSPTVSSVTEGLSASYTIDTDKALGAGVTATVNVGLSFAGGAGSASAADISGTLAAALLAATLPTGVSLSGTTLTFTSAYVPGTGVTFALPTVGDNLVEADEAFTVSLSGAASAQASVNPQVSATYGSVGTTIVDDDVLTFSIKETGDAVSPTTSSVVEGGSASYTIDIDKLLGAGVTASVNVGITGTGGAGQASLADFGNGAPASFDAVITAALLAATLPTGVTVSGTTVTFSSAYVLGSGGFTFTLPTYDDNILPSEGSETFVVTLSSPTSLTAGEAPVVSGSNGSVTTTILDNDVGAPPPPPNQAPTNLHFEMNPGAGNSLTNLGNFVASDSDGPILLSYSGSLSGVSGTLGASINSSTGQLGLSGSGTGVLTVTVTDGGASIQKSYAIWVGTSGSNSQIFVEPVDDAIAAGLGAADVITGTDGADFLYGGSGDDTLTGGGGADWLSGANNNDTFKFVATSDSTPSAYDTIVDWGSGDNKINLTDIDANTGTVLNDAFTYGGQTSSVLANNVTWYSDGTNTWVQADTDGNAGNGAELLIELLGVHTLTVIDFGL